MRAAAALSACLAMLSAASAQAGCPGGAIRLDAGTDLQRSVDVAPSGASFCIAGLHRMQSVVPKRGQRFFGAPGATLNGSRLLTRFTRQDRFWVAEGQTQQGDSPQRRECLPDRPRCARPEQVFVDDKPLVAVDDRRKVDAGSFFFDYAADRIYIAADPVGRTVEASVSPYAFLGGAADVTIDGLRIEKYSTSIQAGAVGGAIASDGWIVRNNEVRLNHALGVTVGSGSRVVANRIADNGEMGIGCVGDDILIEDNEISGNGFFAGLDPFWEGGGGKCALTRGLVFRRNYAHHNNAFGFWTDIDNIDTLYEDNRIEYNANGGISHEISYRAVIRNNTFKGNGRAFSVWLWGGAIQIQNSQDVEIYGNTVTVSGGGNGICLVQQSRGSGRYGPYVTARNHVHDNRITVATPDAGGSGAIADHDARGLRNAGNRFEGNAYRVRGNDDQWAWVDRFYTWEEFRRVSGQERTGRRIVVH